MSKMFRTLAHAKAALSSKAAFKPAQILRSRAQTPTLRPSEDSHVLAYAGGTATLGFFGMMGYSIQHQEIRTFDDAGEVALVSIGAGLISPIALPFLAVWYGIGNVVYYAFRKDSSSGSRMTQYV